MVSGILFPLVSIFIKTLKKSTGIRVILDFQGALEELTEFKRHYGKTFLFKFIYFFLKKAEKIFLNKVADGVEVVSDNCNKYLSNQYGYSGKTIKVSCGINQPFSKREWAEKRKYWKSKLGIPDNLNSFVYSGGIYPWQNIDEVVSFAYRNKSTVVYIFTPKRHHEKIKSKAPNNLFVRYLEHIEMVSALCAFDFGFLLRDSNYTNFVAFPNKYSEYINARLSVIVYENEIGCKPVDEKAKEALLTNYSKFNGAAFFTRGEPNEDEYNNEIRKLSYSTNVKKLSEFYDCLRK